MLDISFMELMLVAIVGLLVIGPERLPETLRTLGLWLGRLSRSFSNVKAEIEKEIGMDEVKRQLHNEAIMEQMKRIENEVQESVDEATINPPQTNTPAAGQVDAAESGEAEEAPAADAAPANQDADQADADQSAAVNEPASAPLPPTDAELEAEFERKQRQQRSVT